MSNGTATHQACMAIPLRRRRAAGADRNFLGVCADMTEAEVQTR
jgi:hypothetical protein